MRRTGHVVTAALLLPLVLAGCSTGSPGQASPAATAPTDTFGQPPTSGAAHQVPGYGAPPVDNPLDITRYKQSPCTALTQAQIDGFLGPGVPPKTDLEAPAGPDCTWDKPGGTHAGVAVIFTKITQDGLTAIYRNKGATYPFFLPLDPVQGYPAVAYGSKDERSDRGRCHLAIGTNDHSTIDVAAYLGEQFIGKKDPCAAAHDVADAIITNIKGGN